MNERDAAERPTPTGCCPPFDPTPWRGREVTWRDKLFVKERVRSVLHVPLGMDRTMTRAMRRIEDAGATAAEPLMLSDDPSPWRSDLYIAVSRPVPGAEMATLSGQFHTEVFDGPFRDAPRWMDETRRAVTARGRTPRKLYLAYTTCPACARAYGHNYVIVFAELEPVARAIEAAP